MRPLSGEEYAVIERLTSVPFIGNQHLKEQLNAVSVEDDHRKSGIIVTLGVADPQNVRKAVVSRRVPIVAEGTDIDGSVIHVLLHVVNGLLRELELIRVDGLTPLSYPDATSLRIIELDGKRLGSLH